MRSARIQLHRATLIALYCFIPPLSLQNIFTAMNIHDFDAIRPIEPDEIPAAIDELFAEPQFCAIVQSFFKGVPVEALKAKAKMCHSNLEFQKAFFYPLIKQLMAKCASSLTLDVEAIPVDQRDKSYTFVSNHRDIVLDSALLDILLIDNQFSDTIEIAIGDNLLIYPWIKTLVRLNKSFIVQRSVGMREMLMSSKRMSEYMHFAIREKHQGIWIAQREGRAKDSNDRTQESILKMMTMGGEGTPLERLKELNIVPMSISYEYDPCDFLKAKEFQQKRDDAAFKKSRQDDLTNMQTGIFGKKGHVHYRMAEPINTWIDQYAELPKNEFYKAVAARMDVAIHQGYEVYANNYVALDLLNGNNAQAAHYTAEEKHSFEQYLQERIGMIDLPNKDVDFLRERLLTMYANPLINQLKANA